MTVQYLVHAVGPVSGLDRGRELAARPDVADDGLLDAGEELGAVLHHGGEPGRPRNVQRHLERVCLRGLRVISGKLSISPFLQSRTTKISCTFSVCEKKGR